MLKNRGFLRCATRQEIASKNFVKKSTNTPERRLTMVWGCDRLAPSCCRLWAGTQRYLFAFPSVAIPLDEWA